MIVTVKAGVDARGVERALTGMGLWVKRFHDDRDRVLLLVETHSQAVPIAALRALDGIEAVADAPSPHPRLDRQPPIVEIGGIALGVGQPPVIMAGPCSVESEEQIHAVAAALAPRGVRFLRGGAFKPRTSPYAFQGHGDSALAWLADAARTHGMRVVTEALGEGNAENVAQHADLIQIGSRNMHSSALVRAVAQTGKPVLLKRGMAATIEEWLSAAEAALLHGAPTVILCERGIRSFDPQTRYLLDLSAVALLAHAHGLPVIVDPSHGVGRRDLIAPLARAAIAAGAVGLLIETHDHPAQALSDGAQALTLDQFAALVASLGPVTTAGGAR